MSEKLFSRNTIVALFVGLLSWGIGWYGLVLLSDMTDNYFPKPTRNQLIGLCFTLLLSTVSWFQFIYTVRGHD